MADWNSKLNDAATGAEAEVRKLITYLNDEVVPDVRRHGSAALRTAAEKMQELAQSMDDRNKPGTPPR